MKEIDDTPKDALTDGISDAVRDIAEKSEAMAGWEREYSRKRRHVRILAVPLASAACLAFGVFLYLNNPFRTVRKEPALRGGLSYDTAVVRIDSLINAGDTDAARELLMETRYKITLDTMSMFNPMEQKSSKEEIEYSRILVKDVLSRLDELEGKILKTNE